ncbi:hypothetical protein HYH03_002787 [Edaphochlamys debaryana]|uniref:Cell cycle checkpoint protein RAD1 n=1 Tax=Edaphochlamys debaryana TaxID=47281 RepID=A0A835YE44_9CHLO|nr:hypothetical protein HYH03_002787 [Edaphochlamys debaryana]|eukprot:KAG2499206.1 hypothetical protein HYH03_002787 [Edaphochlamys debaryana]
MSRVDGAVSEGPPEAGAEESQVVSLGISNVKSFAAALQCLRASNKQTCTVQIHTEGVSFLWEDDSKALQSNLLFKPELFSRYTCASGVYHEFGIQLQLLLDTLAVFASASAPMTAHYPGPQAELVCEMTDITAGTGPGQRASGLGGAYGGGGLGPGAVCTWARIASLEPRSVVDMQDHWVEPTSSFLCPGFLLKEAIDDLEWPGGAVEVRLQQDPQRLVLASAGHGVLEVEIPSNRVSGFHCTQPEVRFSYKYRHIKLACCNLPNPRDCAAISTKVSIDANGILKITHMLGLDPQPGGRGLAGDQPSALFESQRLINSNKVAVIQFLLQASEEEGAPS